MPVVQAGLSATTHSVQYNIRYLLAEWIETDLPLTHTHTHTPAEFPLITFFAYSVH